MMAGRCFFLWVGCLLVQNRSLFAGDISPLRLSSPSIELHNIEPGQTIDYEIVFTNVSAQPLTMVSVVGSCRCISPRLPKAGLECPAGKRSSISIQLSTAGRRTRDFTERVVLKYRSGSEEYVQLVPIRCEFTRERLTSHPEALVLGDIRIGDNIDRTATVSGWKGMTQELNVDGPDWLSTTVEATGEATWRIKAAGAVPREIGSFTDEIRLWAGKRELHVPVIGTVLGDIIWKPRTLFAVSKDERVRLVVDFEDALGRGRFELSDAVVEATNSAEGDTTRVTVHTEEGSKRLRFDATRGNEDHLIDRGTIVVSFKITDRERISARVPYLIIWK